MGTNGYTVDTGGIQDPIGDFTGVTATAWYKLMPLSEFLVAIVVSGSYPAVAEVFQGGESCTNLTGTSTYVTGGVTAVSSFDSWK